MHRNTFINSPHLLTANYQLRKQSQIYFAGQITGVEGYVESAGSGLVAALALYQQLNKKEFNLSSKTMLGAMGNYVANADSKHFQPMNANFGIISPLNVKVKNKIERRNIMAQRALKIVQELEV